MQIDFDPSTEDTRSHPDPGRCTQAHKLARRTLRGGWDDIPAPSTAKAEFVYCRFGWHCAPDMRLSKKGSKKTGPRRSFLQNLAKMSERLRQKNIGACYVSFACVYCWSAAAGGKVNDFRNVSGEIVYFRRTVRRWPVRESFTFPPAAARVPFTRAAAICITG